MPELRVAVSVLASRLVDQYGEELSVRLEELFAKESDPYTSNDFMLTCMNDIRVHKFHAAVEEALAASGPKPESVDSLKNDVKRRLSDWYLRHHGVGPAACVEDMCVLLRAYWSVATKR